MKRRSVLNLVAAMALLGTAMPLHAQTMVITEFMAQNRAGILDEDGDSSDWIEIQNQGTAAVNLGGWHLSDDATDLRKWRFPATEILPGSFLLIFASGKDRSTSSSELHANFRLDRSGEFLGLVAPDGVEPVHAYSPTYPPQRAGISYGYSQRAARNAFVLGGSAARLWVPDDERLGNDWTETNFDDAWWQAATTGIGFATGTEPPPPTRIENVAPGGRATQSSIGWGGDPMRGIDGNTDGQWEAGSIFHTDGANAWWEVDLQDFYAIDSIKLWNRLDCCSERLLDFTVQVLDSNRQVTFETGPHDGRSQATFTIAGVDAEGQFVRIAMPGRYLHLAEVQIFGEVFDEDLSFQRHVSTDIAAEMLDRNASVYLRIPFEVENPDLLDTLTLRLKYDDGFIAYLNGTEVVRRNAPDLPRWNSTASREHPTENVLVFDGFDLSASTDLLLPGTNMLAIHGFNLTLGDDDFLLFPELVGFRFSNQVESYMLEPSPGEANDGESFAGFVADTRFSQDRGFYDEPFDVAITTDTEGAEIIYTVDGTTPTATNGNAYTGPVRITTTTILRAIAVKDGLGPTNTDTHTYIFLDDVIDSPVMNTSVTRDARYAPLMRTGLTDLPSLCITAGTETFPSEVPISLELIHPDGTPGFQEDAGAKYFGLRWAGSTYVKKSLRISFRSEYGDSKLRYPLFAGQDHGIPPVEIFDQIELRSGHHDADLRGFYMSDRFTSDTMLDMGHLNPHGRFVHLYLDGVYWGQYNMRERWSASMLAQYFGGEEEDYEAIKANGGPWNWDAVGVPYNGNGSTWATIRSLRSDFEGIGRHLDVSQYIDFMLMFMIGNSELEFRCVGSAAPGVGFKFFMNDPDGYLRGPGASGGGRPGFNFNPAQMSQPGRLVGDGPGSIFSMLLDENHPDYRILLADRIQDIFFEGGPMSPEKNRDRLLARCDEIERAFLAESARWGYRSPESWANARDSFVDGVLPKRTAVMVEHYRDAGLMLSVPVPSFMIDDRVQHGGKIASGAELAMRIAGPEIEPAEGSILFTMDASDPRLPGGDISPTAIPYTDPVILTKSTLVSARVRTRNGSWGAMTDTVFHVDLPLRITEIMYNPPSPIRVGAWENDQFEFVELQNVGNEPISLAGVKFVEGVRFDFRESVDPEDDLLPGETTVVVSNLEAFSSRYDTSTLRIAGEYEGQFDNTGERIVLIDSFARALLDFTFSDDWYPATDGDGVSLEIVDARAPADTWSLAASWIEGSLFGSPGFHDAGIPPNGGLRRQGDFNGDAALDLSDAVATLTHLFVKPRELPCEGKLTDEGNLHLADVNGDRLVNIADAIHLLAYLFQGGSGPVDGPGCVRIAGCSHLCAN